MTDFNAPITGDVHLDEYAEYLAQEVYDQYDSDDDRRDGVHECADSDQHVIHPQKAHSICQNCDISQGEAFLEDVGPPSEPTYDSLAVAIAYGELRARVSEALEALIEAHEKEEED